MSKDATPKYEAPVVTDHGDLVALTAQQNTGSSFDVTKPQPGFVLSGGTGVVQPTPFVPAGPQNH